MALDLIKEKFCHFLADASAAGWTAPSTSYDNLRSVIIVGWSANYGTTWASVSNAIANGGLSDGYYGVSTIGTSYAGGRSAGLPSVECVGRQWYPGCHGHHAVGIDPGLHGFGRIARTAVYLDPTGGSGCVAIGTNLTLKVSLPRDHGSCIIIGGKARTQSGGRRTLITRS